MRFISARPPLRRRINKFVPGTKVTRRAEATQTLSTVSQSAASKLKIKATA